MMGELSLSTNPPVRVTSAADSASLPSDWRMKLCTSRVDERTVSENESVRISEDKLRENAERIGLMVSPKKLEACRPSSAARAATGLPFMSITAMLVSVR